MRYQLPDGNVIIADQAFIDAKYPDAVLIPEAVDVKVEIDGDDPVSGHKFLGLITINETGGIELIDTYTMSVDEILSLVKASS